MVKFFSMNEKIYNVRINRNEVLRYLGFTKNVQADIKTGADTETALPADTKINQTKSAASTGNAENNSVDRNIAAQIEQCEKMVLDAAQPKYVYRVLPTERTDDKIRLSGTSLCIEGKDAEKLLAECGSCIVMAATVGQKTDMLLRRAQVYSMADAVILDSCASSAIESICDQLNEDLRKEFESKGLFLTDRYSPGYGDMPLSMQTELCRLLQTEKRIGLSVSPGLTLTPSKSVTAIIGISDRPQKMRVVSCDECRLKDTCNLRKAGQTCGNRKE